MAQRNIYLGVPMGSASLGLGTHCSIMDSVSSKHMVALGHQVSSILPFTFNMLWCKALNMRHERELTHFVLLHSDVAPAKGWIDLLVDLLDEHNLDVLSAVVPLKARHGLGSGLTSTAVDTDPWRPRRISTTEFSKLPIKGVLDNEFFRQRYNADLLINTGLMCIRLDQKWSPDVCFDFRNRIVLCEDGTYYPQTVPEDWRFARWCHSRNLNIAVTQQIHLVHEGRASFLNRGIWGHTIDPVNIEYVEKNKVVPAIQVAGGLEDGARAN